MAAVVLVVVLIGIYFLAVNTGNTKKRIDIQRRQAAGTKCPHCGNVGASLRSPALGIAKVFTFGLLALVMPGSRKCNTCRYKW